MGSVLPLLPLPFETRRPHNCILRPSWADYTMNLRPNPLHPHVYVPSPTSNLQNSIQYAKRLELLHPFFMPVLLGVIRILDDEDATRYSKMLILPSRLPSSAFLASLSAQEHATVLRAYLIVYSLSRGKMVPHQGQLESSLAAMSGRESISTVQSSSYWGSY